MAQITLFETFGEKHDVFLYYLRGTPDGRTNLSVDGHHHPPLLCAGMASHLPSSSLNHRGHLV